MVSEISEYFTTLRNICALEVFVEKNEVKINCKQFLKIFLNFTIDPGLYNDGTTLPLYR